MFTKGPQTFSNLGIDPGSIADRRAAPDWIFLEGCEAWSMAGHALAHAGLGPCPVCKGNPRNLRPSWYCSGCDRTGLDAKIASGRVKLPGKAVGSIMNEEWLAEYPEEGTHHRAYVPREGLAGGQGKAVKMRRGVARSRKAG